jgi:hypothetical protein
MKGNKDEKAPPYTDSMKRHWGGDSSKMPYKVLIIFDEEHLLSRFVEKAPPSTSSMRSRFDEKMLR